ncbi:MAG TPA: universal stress protein [Xanthobacteraceae bacterium]|jgi:nucleotide-binding universal stress UspA family protein|nr:universal stress protein [Xanthobacteraceae bacterium]
MKTILVPVEPHDSIQSVLETALLVGGKFEAHIEGFALRPAIGNVVTMDPVNSLTVVSLRENDLEIIKEARGIFESFMHGKQVPGADGAGASLSCTWFDGATGGEDFVGNYGRVFDLIVLGRPAKGRQGPRMATLEAALFESGRPVLLAPPTPPRSIGEKILIAWNCSTEQARATAFAMPLLRKAARVIICTVEGATVAGPTGEQMARNLMRNGVPAESITVAPGQRRAGEVMLAQADALGCDLIVKGAYTQSRLRQMIFGGTTQHILTHATVPVLLAH